MTQEEKEYMAYTAFMNESFGGCDVIGGGRFQDNGKVWVCSVHLNDGTRDMLAVYTVEFGDKEISKTHYEII